MRLACPMTRPHPVRAALALALLPLTAARAEEAPPARLWPFGIGDQHGYIDKSGHVVVPAQYDEAHEFSEGLAAVRRGDTWAYVDVTGHEVIKVEPKGRPGAFSEGLAPLEVAWLKVGFIDRNGRLAIPATFGQVQAFSEGLAAVYLHERNKKWGYIDRTGKMVIDVQFDWAVPFSGGLAFVQHGGSGDPFALGDYVPASNRWIDKQGSFMSKSAGTPVSGFAEGLAVASRGKLGYVDRAGAWAIEPKYDDARPFSDGLAAVGIRNASSVQWGFIDKNGKEVVPPRFELVGNFSDGLAMVWNRATFSFIDRAGRVVMENPFEGRGGAGGSFRDGLALIQYGGKGASLFKPFYMDRQGRYVCSYGFESQASPPPPRDWTLRVRALAPDGKPLAGAALWETEIVHGQTNVSTVPIPWAEIGAWHAGVAPATWFWWTKPTGLSTGPDGRISVGPRSGPLEYGGSLVHPDFVTGQMWIDPKKHVPDAAGVIDLGDLTLAKGHIVRGRVIDGEGRPVAGAFVAAQPYMEGERPLHEVRAIYRAWPGAIRVARADADGRYVLKGLQNDRHLVAAWGGAHAPSVQRVEFGLPADVAGVPIGPGGWTEQEIDFQLEGGQTLTVAARTGSGQGKPLVGALVFVNGRDADTLGFTGWGGFTTFVGKTGPDGQCQVSGLPKGDSFRVCVEDTQGNRWCSDRVRPGATETIWACSGSVRLGIVGNAGRPVPVFHYTRQFPEAERSDRHVGAGTFPAFGPGDGQWGRDGRLDVPGLACGAWLVTIYAPGYQVCKTPLSVSADGVDKTLSLEPATGVLSGRAIDALTRQPVGGVRMRANEDWDWRRHPEVDMETATSSDGAFRFASLRGPGSVVHLRIEADGYEPQQMEWTEDKLAHDLGDFTLTPVGALHGTLTRGGKPAARCRVELWVPEGRIRYCGTVDSDDQGRWKREGLPIGKYLLATAGARKEVEVTRGSVTDVGALEIGD